MPGSVARASQPPPEAPPATKWRSLEVLLLAAFATGLALERWVPATFHLSAEVHLSAGAVLMVAGLALVFAARRALGAADRPTVPGAATPRLVQSGAFAYSRNPLYLGAWLAFAGLAVAMDAPWWLATGAAGVLATQVWLIEPEEHALEAAFDHEWRDYWREVGRWF